MSQPSKVTNSADAAKKYIERLLRNPFVLDVYIFGSRSLKKKKQPSDKSDWDILVVTNPETLQGRKLFIPSPRKTGHLHADVVVRDKPTKVCTHWKEILG